MRARSRRWPLCLLSLLTLPILLAPRSALTRPAPARPGPTSPALSFEPCGLDLGALQPAEVRDLEFAWQRHGPGTLRVHAVIPGCGCAGVRGLEGDLREGAAGSLQIRLVAPSRPGPLAVRVRVVTDGRRRGGAPLSDLLLEGWVGRTVAVVPPCVELGPRTVGRREERLLTVRTTRRVGSQPLEARLEGLEGQISVLPPARRGRAGFSLRVGLLIPAEAGPFDGRVCLHAGDGTELQIPVEGIAVR